MQCPQCGVQTADDEWNCASCRINVYWASQHFGDLAGIRRQQGLPAGASTPAFLRSAHERAMDERADRGGRVENRVRQIARRAMRRGEADGETRDSLASPDASTYQTSDTDPDSDTDLE